MNVVSMEHEVAVGRLPDLVSGALDRKDASAIRRHLSECAACRGWVEAYRLLEQAAGAASSVGQEHPAADVLALCAVRPDEPFEPERELLRSHLARCAECREALNALREAVEEARPAAAPVSAARPRRRRAIAWGGLAAALATLGIGFTLFLQDGPRSRAPHAGEPDNRAAHAPADEGRLKAHEELSNLKLEGQHEFSVDRSLLVTHVKVEPGSRVTFRVGEVAAFGDGFQIGNGGAVVVEAGRREREN